MGCLQILILMGFFVLCGGFNVNSVFDYLDFEIIKNNPKIICGYSDPTSLINVIYAKTGLVTFSGPNFKSLSDEDTDYGFNEMKKRFFLNDLKLGTKEDEYKTIRNGVADGILVGGNLCLFSNLTSGKYTVNTKDKILFIEDLGFESPPGMVSNYLYKCKQNGVFENIKGLWIGNYEHESGITLEQIVSDVLEDEYNFPIIKSNNFGHGLLKTVIPIGVKARIDTESDEKIKLLEYALI